MAFADREPGDEESVLRRSDSLPKLPDPRLNPLLNPLLAKQLGRWAHVYYTHSVDQREAAVESLVRELEAEAAKRDGLTNDGLTNDGLTTEDAARVAPAIAEASHFAVATAAREPDAPVPPEVEVTAAQAIPFPSSVIEFPQPVASVAVHEMETHLHSNGLPSYAPPPQEEDPSRAETTAFDVAELQPELADQDQIREPEHQPEQPSAPEIRAWPQTASESPIEDSPSSQAPATPSVPMLEHFAEPERTAEADYNYFHALREMSEVPEISTAPPTAWRRMALAAGFLLVVGGLFWAASRRHEPSAKPALAQQPAANPATSAPSPDSAVSSPPPAASNSSVAKSPLPAKMQESNAAEAIAPRQPNTREALAPVGTPTTAPSAANADGAADPELAAGLRYLQGNGVPRNSEEAARHLWQSVRQQNGSALVVLAGLYAQGDGVAKDCDQATVLLNAAAKQAKSHSQFLHVEATRETLRTSGCD